MSITSSITRTLRSVPTWGWVVGGTVAATTIAILFWRSRAEAKPLQPGERRILVLGDSITVGYLPKLKAWLSSDEIIGEGYGGRQTPYITNKGREFLAQQPTHVVILGGINDISSSRTPRQIYTTLSAFWREAKQKTGAKIVAMKLTPCSGYAKFKRGTTMGNRVDELNEMIVNAVGSPDSVDAVIDTDSLGDENRALLKEYSSGGLHMTAAGSQKLAELVADGLP